MNKDVYLYIIQCSDGNYYTGTTNNLNRRFREHSSGNGSRYTARQKPENLVYFEKYDTMDDARKREKQVKDWSQEKKKKLISGQWKKEVLD